MKNKSFFYFPPWRKQFFFSSDLLKSSDYTSQLFYNPYVLSSKIVWFLWLKFRIFRSLFIVKHSNLPSLFYIIKRSLNLDDFLFQINVGTVSIEQKMSIIAFNDDTKLFIKAGTTNLALQLLANEANTLKMINGRLGVPQVIQFHQEDNLGILTTTVVTGKKFETITINSSIFEYLIKIAELEQFTMQNKIVYTIAHGDFCPWNFVEKKDGNFVVIDWELSNKHPLGYDLFTFIFQTQFLLNPQKNICIILRENEKWISSYFKREQSQEDYRYYLLLFTATKIRLEKLKGQTKLLKKWILLNEFIAKQ